nr:MAG TPA: hypothetical protein [Caudoviricetes sp.]
MHKSHLTVWATSRCYPLLKREAIRMLSKISNIINLHTNDRSI